MGNSLPDIQPSLVANSSPGSQDQEASAVRLGSVVGALSQALDLSTGQPMGHSIKSCLVGMRLAEEIGLPAQARHDLLYSLLLKDCGCSANSSKTYHALQADDLKAKFDVKTTDWTSTSWETIQYALAHVAVGKPFLERMRALFDLAVNQKSHAKNVTSVRCERGASLARLMGLSESTAVAILNLDEHWDGGGLPQGFHGSEIPIASRIMLLSQTLEVFSSGHGENAAINVAIERSRKWFDPDLVKAARSLHRRNQLGDHRETHAILQSCLELEPNPRMMNPTDNSLDDICMAFSYIVDAKSPFTFNHSVGVANAAVAIATTLGLSRERTLFIRHAGLLHDLGKLGVSNEILEKPGKLDDREWISMRKHPSYTWQILNSIPGFAEMSEVAGSHHEKLDGSGYFRGLTAERLSIESRALAVADVFDALTGDRPYRKGLALEVVMQILKKDAPHALDMSCVEALEFSGTVGNQTLVSLQSLNDQLLARQSTISK